MSRVAVVGAGIVGLATAHALRARGADVTLYESGPPGGGQSAGQSGSSGTPTTTPGWWRWSPAAGLCGGPGSRSSAWS
nr:FAD-dependent oxidoreductase [Kocuria sp. CNJ-770]